MTSWAVSLTRKNYSSSLLDVLDGALRPLFMIRMPLWICLVSAFLSHAQTDLE